MMLPSKSNTKRESPMQKKEKIREEYEQVMAQLQKLGLCFC